MRFGGDGPRRMSWRRSRYGMNRYGGGYHYSSNTMEDEDEKPVRPMWPAGPNLSSRSGGRGRWIRGYSLTNSGIRNPGMV